MFNFFKQKPTGQVATLKLSGLHCTSCSLNIDGELEDTPGVIKSTTSYAKSETVVEYDPTKVDVGKLRSVIESLNYQVVK